MYILIFISIFALTVIAQETSDTNVYNLYDKLEYTQSFHMENNFYILDMMRLLGLEENPHKHLNHQLSLRSSASKFLLEVYNDITENEHELDHIREYVAYGSRQKRALRDDNFITTLDRMEIEKCNNIITFSGKKTSDTTNQQLIPDITIASDMQIGFSTNDVPRDLQLVHATLRIYQQPSCGNVSQVATVSIYQKVIYRREYTGGLRILTSVNTTTSYKGWLEFNITGVLNSWLQQKSGHINELIVGVTINVNNSTNKAEWVEILASELGLIKPDFSEDIIDLQPFVIGFFSGPELIAKVQNMRFKRDVVKPKRLPPPKQKIYKSSKACERLNFTLDFEDIRMHEVVIAPKKFEAYFCAGECNFPLGSKLNATNHAIVQTLMQLKRPNLPKPCCVPTVLGSILVLYHLNKDSVNLVKYSQIVAKECGCH